MTKTFDCVKFQLEVRAKMLKEANYDLHTLIHQVKENNKKSKFYKLFTDRKTGS
jgi:hypothetical protein